MSTVEVARQADTFLLDEVLTPADAKNQDCVPVLRKQCQ